MSPKLAPLNQLNSLRQHVYYVTQRSQPKKMDRHAGNECMDTLPGAFNLPWVIMLRKRYLCVARRQEKSRILDQYCANTG